MSRVRAEWWLHIIERAERLAGIAGAFTIAWIMLWYELTSHHEERITCLVYMMVLGFSSIMLAGVTWVWKYLLHEIIDADESDEEWNRIQGAHWPPIERSDTD